MIVAVVVLLVLALVALAVTGFERYLRGPVFDRLRGDLASAMRVDRGQVDLEVEARTLLPVLLGRRDTRARMIAREVPIGDEGGRLRDVEVTLHGVRGAPRRRAVLLDGGRFTAVLDERELPDLLPLRGVVTRTEVRADGLRLWTVAAVPVDADVIVAGERLVVVPDPAQLSKLMELPGLRAVSRFVPKPELSVPLPELPLEASIREVEFDAGVVRITGLVPPQELARDGGRVRARRANPDRGRPA